MMKTLQLYIFKSLNGFKNLRNFNADEAVLARIREMRGALEVLDYDPAEKYLFYMVSYTEAGAMFTILRTIPDKLADHLATVIFVPNDLKITAKEMADVVKRTSRVISNQSVTSEDLAELGEIFAREYPTVENPLAMRASAAKGFAFSLYGGDNGRQLNDYLGDKLYKPEYAEYAGVLLIDKVLGVNCSAANVDEDKAVEAAPPVEATTIETKTEEKNVESHTQRPASKPTTSRIAETRARVYRFELPMKAANLGAPIRFEIRSKNAIDESPIEGYRLLDDIQEGAGRMNYLDYERPAAGMPQRLTIIMVACALVLGLLVGYLIWGGSDSKKDEAKAVETELVDENKVAAAEDATKKAEPAAKPEQPKAEAKEEPKPKAEEPKVEEKKPAAKSNVEIKVNQPTATMADAVKYLEDNKSWKRAEMEKYPALQGLFDDMNKFRYDRLTKHWGPQLKDSPYFQKVVYHIDNGRRKPRPAEGDTYTTDNVISRYGFCCAVDK